FYIDVSSCAKFGSNPNGTRQTNKGEKPNKDAQGNIITPLYAVTSEQDGKIHIQYLTIYGFNGPYAQFGVKGAIDDIQNAHNGDIEHVSVIINKQTKELEKIYF